MGKALCNYGGIKFVCTCTIDAIYCLPACQCGTYPKSNKMGKIRRRKRGKQITLLGPCWLQMRGILYSRCSSSKIHWCVQGSKREGRPGPSLGDQGPDLRGKRLLNDWRHSWCTYDVFVGVRMTSLPVYRKTFGYLSLYHCLSVW